MNVDVKKEAGSEDKQWQELELLRGFLLLPAAAATSPSTSAAATSLLPRRRAVVVRLVVVGFLFCAVKLLPVRRVGPPGAGAARAPAAPAFPVSRPERIRLVGPGNEATHNVTQEWKQEEEAKNIRRSTKFLVGFFGFFAVLSHVRSRHELHFFGRFVNFTEQVIAVTWDFGKKRRITEGPG